MSSFMRPEITGKIEWWEIDGDHGVTVYPADDLSLIDAINYYGQSHVRAIERVKGHGVRLSAPGYLDATDWSVFPTVEAAKAHLREFENICPECGADISEDPCACGGGRIMSDAYVFQAALWCEYCAGKIRADLDARNVEDTGDSDDYPQGPYADGGGESDAPANCDGCRAFLENPLTSDGIRYVQDLIFDYVTKNRGKDETIAEWSRFYDIPIPTECVHFDRFDIVEAYYALDVDWNSNGRLPRRESVSGQLDRMRFNPRRSLGGFWTLDENAQGIYLSAARRMELIK